MVANKVELPLKGGRGAVVVFMSGQTETHSLGFLSVAESALTSGEDSLPQNEQWRNNNAADRRLFRRRFEPRSGENGGGAADDNRLVRIRTADQKACRQLCYHSTVVCCYSAAHPHCLEPFDHKYHALG